MMGLIFALPATIKEGPLILLSVLTKVGHDIASMSELLHFSEKEAYKWNFSKNLI